MHRKRLIRPFWNMSYEGIPDFQTPDDFDGLVSLVPGRGRANLLLGCYDEAFVRERFAHYSVLKHLTDLGYHGLKISINATNPDHQLLEVHPLLEGGHPGPHALAEVILREVVSTPDSAIMPGSRSFALLVIQWLRLQNPLVSHDPRALLPGQLFPGLGMGRKVIEMLQGITRRRHLEGIVNRPEFLHNAWLYSPHFHYLDPVAEGRLLALKRDLAEFNLWQVAWAAHQRLIIEDNERIVFHWYQGEQVLPQCDDLRDCFRGADWLATVNQVSSSCRYAIRVDALDSL